MDIEHIKKLCTEWQELLRMRDWAIEIEFVNDETMKAISPDENLPAAYVTCSQDHMRALIRILEPPLWSKVLKRRGAARPVTASDRDVEQVLVHELIHICQDKQFIGWEERTELEETIMEQTVWQITKALIKLKYRGS